MCCQERSLTADYLRWNPQPRLLPLGHCFWALSYDAKAVSKVFALPVDITLPTLYAAKTSCPLAVFMLFHLTSVPCSAVKITIIIKTIISIPQDNGLISHGEDGCVV